MDIKKVKFSKEGAEEISQEWYGTNWPVVYIINNKKDAYIGETTSIRSRIKQHLEDEKKSDLQEISVIANETFNKSSILDIESKLIQYMSADRQYDLLNGNSGMRDHNFYDKPMYEAHFKSIWRELKKLEFVKHDLDILLNSDLFKYTPYKILTEDQYEIVYDIAIDIIRSIENNVKSTTVVHGEAGTGKTVLAMYLLKLFTDNQVLNLIADGNEEIYERFSNIETYLEDFNAAIVVPMTSLRGTLRKVVSQVKGLKRSMIIGPNDVVKNNYDLLIVDESHRLHRRKSITNYASYDNVNKKLGFQKEATQLDWIVQSADHVILFYDNAQSVRPSDIRAEEFQNLILNGNLSTYNLRSQLRVSGGKDYLSYVKSLIYSNPPEQAQFFNNYDFKIFNSITDMRNLIIEKDNELGLARLVAGYAWEWVTKGKKLEEIVDNGLYDIHINGEKLIWNTSDKGWVISQNSLNEIGSIHTIQGYDLNYAGVILGNDIGYDPEIGQVVVNKDSYFDTKGKSGLISEEELKDYILNIYSILLTRGIYGTYLYICDENLKKYLSQYIEVI